MVVLNCLRISRIPNLKRNGVLVSANYFNAIWKTTFLNDFMFITWPIYLCIINFAGGKMQLIVIFAYWLSHIIHILISWFNFQVIHERARKAAEGRNRGVSGGATVIENLAQTKRLAETNLSGPSNAVAVSKKAGGLTVDDVGADDEKCTNTGSGSQVRILFFYHHCMRV